MTSSSMHPREVFSNLGHQLCSRHEGIEIHVRGLREETFKTIGGFDLVAAITDFGLCLH